MFWSSRSGVTGCDSVKLDFGLKKNGAVLGPLDRGWRGWRRVTPSRLESQIKSVYPPVTVTLSRLGGLSVLLLDLSKSSDQTNHTRSKFCCHFWSACSVKSFAMATHCVEPQIPHNVWKLSAQRPQCWQCQSYSCNCRRKVGNCLRNIGNGGAMTGRQRLAHEAHIEISVE